MAGDPLAQVRNQIGERLAEINDRGPRLSPLDLHAKVEAIRKLAADHGMEALEGLARFSAQYALLPGRRVAMRTCLDHMGDALVSSSAGDRATILAALAVRLH